MSALRKSLFDLGEKRFAFEHNGDLIKEKFHFPLNLGNSHFFSYFWCEFNAAHLRALQMSSKGQKYIKISVRNWASDFLLAFLGASKRQKILKAEKGESHLHDENSSAAFEELLINSNIREKWSTKVCFVLNESFHLNPRAKRKNIWMAPLEPFCCLLRAWERDNFASRPNWSFCTQLQ